MPTGSGGDYPKNPQLNTVYVFDGCKWMYNGKAFFAIGPHNEPEQATSGSTQVSPAGQKLSFFGATPVVQPTGTAANAVDLPTALTLVNDLKTKLKSLGLIA